MIPPCPKCQKRLKVHLLRVERKGDQRQRRYKADCCSIEFYNETPVVTRYPKVQSPATPPANLTIDDSTIEEIPVEPTRPISGTESTINPRAEFSSAKRSTCQVPPPFSEVLPSGKLKLPRIPESLEDALDLVGVWGSAINADRLAVAKD
jgi:hypothetical protein